METSDPVFHSIDLDNMRGLEIGPLYRPRVPQPLYDVRYVDHYSTDELRAGYAANSQVAPFVDEIVEVDYVLGDGETISSVTKGDAPFDYLIASHVIEHIPNPIGWFQDVCEILSPGGVISLVVPDKRFCFDVNRDLTSSQDWIDWYLRGLDAPSYAQVFDFFGYVATLDGTVDTAALWAGTADYSDVHRSDVADPEAAAFAECIKHQQTGEIKDIHAGVYTPQSFLRLVRLAIKLELLNFEVAHFESTPINTLEFYVSLRNAPEGSVHSRLKSVDRALAASRDAEGPPRLKCGVPSLASDGLASVASDGSESVLLSRKELRLIAMKRSILARLRNHRVTTH